MKPVAVLTISDSSAAHTRRPLRSGSVCAVGTTGLAGAVREVIPTRRADRRASRALADGGAVGGYHHGETGLADAT